MICLQLLKLLMLDIGNYKIEHKDAGVEFCLNLLTTEGNILDNNGRAEIEISVQLTMISLALFRVYYIRFNKAQPSKLLQQLLISILMTAW